MFRKIIHITFFAESMSLAFGATLTAGLIRERTATSGDFFASNELFHLMAYLLFLLSINIYMRFIKNSNTKICAFSLIAILIIAMPWIYPEANADKEAIVGPMLLFPLMHASIFGLANQGLAVAAYIYFVAVRSILCITSSAQLLRKRSAKRL